MLDRFYKLGNELAWAEAAKTAGWAGPVLGGLGGAALAPWLLPYLGMEDQAINPALGALLGAGLGLGGAEMLRGARDLAKPIAQEETSQILREGRAAIREAIEQFKAEQAKALASPAVS